MRAASDPGASLPPRFENPGADRMRELLRGARTIAVVGYSPRPDRPSYRIARRLQAWGYRVFPVRPGLQEAIGETVYARLADLPVRPDLVNVFRAAPQIDTVIDECLALNLPAVWIQEGIVNEAAAERARARGMLVVMDRCISVEYRRLEVESLRASELAKPHP